MNAFVSKKGWLALGVVAIAGLVLYLFGVTGNPEESAAYGRSAIGWMIGRWNWSGADMSHGWMIPLVGLYALWCRRGALQKAPKATAGLGLWVVILSLLVYLAAMRVQQTRLVLMSLMGLLWGIPFFLGGRTVASLLVFPCGYLVFCIPLTFIDSLTLPLRLISTTLSAGFLNGMGIAVTRVGTAIHVAAGGGFSLDVGHPCSGLRYLLAMVALTVAYAQFTQTSFLKRGILWASAIPLAIAGNMVRIVLIAVVGIVFGTKAALGFYHDYSGYVVFAVATLLMLREGTLLNRFGARPPGREGTAPEIPKAAPSPSFLSFPVGLMMVVGLLVLTAGLAARIQQVSLASSSTADVLTVLPRQVGVWQGQEVFYCQNEQCLRSFNAEEVGDRRICPVCDGRLDEVALGERNLLPADTILTRKIYRNPRQDMVTVTIVLSGREQKSIHRPQQCLPAQGFVIEESRMMTVPLDSQGELKLTLLRARPGITAPGSAAGRVLMAYWFAGGGRETPSHFERLAWMAWDNLAHGVRSRWAYVSLQTFETSSEAAAEKRIAELARALYPVIRRPPAP